jgi:hypothetical protein
MFCLLKKGQNELLNCESTFFKENDRYLSSDKIVLNVKYFAISDDMCRPMNHDSRLNVAAIV